VNLIPFESASLPAYLSGTDIAALNADLLSHAGGGFPVISIKGKVFAITRDGERKVLPNPKDPDSPATSIDVVMIKANKGTSKVFYMKGYDPESSAGQKPDCYSADGIAPAGDAQSPQAKTCATCKNNQWGSRITEKGASKGKACNDTVRMAVSPAGQINDPMLLRVPPASIRAIGEYGQMLAKRGVAYNMVVTKISFDQDAESPKLMFKPVGFLDENAHAEVQEMIGSDIVSNILGSSMQSVVGPVSEDEAALDAMIAKKQAADAAAAKPEPEVVAKPAVKTAARKPVEKPAPVVEDAAPAAAGGDIEIDLDGISFDD
jgi:hypothetical protein